MSKRAWDSASGPGGEADPVAAAARAAADVAARVGSGGSLRGWDNPPSSGNEIVAGPVKAPTREVNDPAFVKDIEINDLRNRYLLTKATTQHQIQEDTGASVQTKGTWIPDTSIPTRDAPLYLHVTATTQQSLDRAVEAIYKLIGQELGPLTHRPGMGEQERPQRRKWPEEKVPIVIEPLRNFNVRAKIVGPAGLFVKYIQQETGCRVQIKGLGSGFVEQETGREADEPIHVAIVGPEEAQVKRAKTMAEDLLAVVTEKWHEARMLIDGGMGYNMPAYNGALGSNQYNYAQQGYQQPGQAPPLPAGAPPAAPVDAAAQQKAHEEYMAQINSNPAYAEYYRKLMEYYAQNPGAAGAPGQPPMPAAAPAPPPSSAPPPPPSSAPPPPPADARREGKGAYGAVPPPNL